MKTIRRLIYAELVKSIAFICLGFLALFSFFDFVDELASVGKSAYQIGHAALYVALQMPSHIYELLPIATLIGGVLVMARFAQNSEFTILRTSGLGPQLALKTLLLLGCFFVALTFVVGDYIAPLSSKVGQLMKAQYQGNLRVGNTGAWLKERQRYNHFAVNVGTITPSGDLEQVRIYEFDSAGALVSLTDAASVSFDDDAWLLHTAKRIEFPENSVLKTNPDKRFALWKTPSQRPKITITESAQLRWPTQINTQMVSVALLKPERMSTLHLFQYVQHLKDNSQSAQLYEIEFWKKIFYPLSCLVMLMLALPFAYLHFRQTGIAAYVFGGVLTGISFFLLNNVFGYIGNISHWPPMLAAAAPSVIYLAISLVTFTWIVFKK
jgi:lipopolysaccharide export system permease protein